MKRLHRLVCLAVYSSIAACCATISVEPSAPVATLGSPVTLSVNVAGVPDLFAWQFDVAFNPAVLSAVSVTEGSLFSSSGVFFSPGIIDNTAGTISFISDSLSGPGPGLSTDGTLAQIVFHARGAGSTAVDLANVLLLDSSLNDIGVDVLGGTVTVTGTSPVPEPGTLALVFVSLAAIAVIRRTQGFSERRRRLQDCLGECFFDGLFSFGAKYFR